jgi:geranylgeranyl diphosphate synthase type I
MKKPISKPDAAIEEIQRIFLKRGTSILEQARKRVLEEKLQSQDAQKALSYFMNEYWQDTARPSLMALACEAVGGNSELTSPIAVPMILISGAIDIHDDIIDQSKTKDGRPTVYGKFGKEIALLVGDALLFKGLVMLNETSVTGIQAEKMSRILEIIKKMFFELGDAEALELEFRGRLDISPRKYLQVVRMKAADVEAHTRISAILGNASNKEIKALSEYGRLLGMMIILRDDLIDLMIPEECQSRIRAEALPLPLLYGLRDPVQRHKLKAMLQSHAVGNKQAQNILEILQDSQAMKQYEELLEKIAAEALSKLKSLPYEAKELQLLIHAMLPTRPEGARTKCGSISTRAEPVP